MLVQWGNALRAIILLGFAVVLGVWSPLAFAAVTFAVAYIMASQLEYSRLAHEYPYYFGESAGQVPQSTLKYWASGTSLAKAVIAAFLGLLTFSGFDMFERGVIAALFAGCAALSGLILVALATAWGIGALRWGYFRLAIPLGVLYSVGINILTPKYISTVKVSELAFSFEKTFGLNRDKNPSLEEAFVFLSKFNQFSGQIMADALDFLAPEIVRPVVEIILSGNILQGLALIPYVAVVVRLSLRPDRD